MVVTYCRLGETLQSMREDFIRPMHDVASDGSQRGVPSKTQCYDDTIELKNQIYPWITKVAVVLAAGRPSETIFEGRCGEFTKEFRRATRALGLKNIVPYQCRHSGASQDKAGQHRSVLEIKKRCWWKSDKSSPRYEKSGRLESQLTYFEVTDLALEELIFGKLGVEDVLRPSLMVAASS